MKEAGLQPECAEVVFPFVNLGDRAQKNISSLVDSFFVEKRHAGIIDEVMITESFTPKHPSSDQLKADGEISEELDEILDMNAIQIVLASSVPRHAKNFGTRVVIAIKEFSTEE